MKRIDKDDAPVPKCLPIKKTMCGILRKGTESDSPGKETALNRTVGDVFSTIGSRSPRREMTRMISMIWKRGSGWPSPGMLDRKLGSIRTMGCGALLHAAIIWRGPHQSTRGRPRKRPKTESNRLSSSQIHAASCFRANETSRSILDYLERNPGR